MHVCVHSFTHTYMYTHVFNDNINHYNLKLETTQMSSIEGGYVNNARHL